jgi:tripartite-type tricarboxylate transporter receptor subunit TctC
MTIAIAVVCASPAIAAEYPTKPIRLIVPVAAGGNVDTVARGVTQRLSDNIGQPVIVENRSGASATIGANAVAKAAPDGYTLSMGQLTPNAIASALFAKLPYDAVKDFVSIILVGTSPGVLVTHPARAARPSFSAACC